jgi:hypothetical protein
MPLPLSTKQGLVEGIAVGTTFIRATLATNAIIFDQVTLEVIAGGTCTPDCTNCPAIEPEDVNVKLGIDTIDDHLDIFAGKE